MLKKRDEKKRNKKGKAKGKGKASTKSNESSSAKKKSSQSGEEENPADSQDAEQNEMICPISRDRDGLPIFDLGGKRRVSISKYKGNLKIDIREYYEHNTTGEVLPTKKGVSLDMATYELLKQIIPSLEHELEVLRK